MTFQGEFGDAPFSEDSRGGRLVRWQAVKAPGTDEPRLRLCGPGSVVRQIEQVVGPCRRLPLNAEMRLEWTHRVRLPRPLSPAERGMLDLLTEVVTIDCGGQVDVMLVLDFYKQPIEGIDPYDWPNSPAGELVRHGKYASNVASGRALCDRLAGVVQRHPLYGSATKVLSVPGSDTRTRSFGERVAAGVARRLGLPLLETTARNEVRPPSKAGDPYDLSQEFAAGGNVTDETVLIVDDVYRSGATMRAVALAAKRAGSRRVLGLAAARTMRR